MDRALKHDNNFNFGEIIYAIEAERGCNYTCILCEEDVFLNRGNKNKAFFSHNDYEHAKNKNCKLRVHSLHINKKYSHTEITALKRWNDQQSEISNDYIPQLPEILFKDKMTWQNIAILLIDEINQNDRTIKESFEKKITKKLNIANSNITRYFIEQEKLTIQQIVDFYWEILLRFRLLYKIFKDSKTHHFKDNRRYESLVSFIDSNIKTNDTTLIPFEFQYDICKKSISCIQKLPNYTKAIKLNDLPHNFADTNNTPEIDKMIKRNYLITKYDEFESCYISTNNQVSIGSQVMIIGILSILENMITSIEPFSDSKIEIISDITNLNKKWGIIIVDLVIPVEMSFINCPSWISWKYIELLGGLRLYNQQNSYSFLFSCPPVIQLNANIPTELLQLTDTTGNIVKFNRINNQLILLTDEVGIYTLVLKNTPYHQTFTLVKPLSCEKVTNEISEWTWFFSDKWPILYKTNGKTNKSGMNGINLVGQWKKMEKLDQYKEWFLIHSKLKKKAKSEINKILLDWSVNVFR